MTVKKESKLLLKHSSIYGLAPGMGRLAGFLMIPVYTVYLSPDDYGVMELLVLTTSLIEMVVGVGIAHGVTRFYFDSDIQSERNKVVSSAFIGLGAVLMPVVVGLIACSSLFAEHVLDNPEYTTLFVIAFISMGLTMLNNINISYLRAEKQSTLVVAASIGQLIVNLTLNIIFIVYLEMGIAGIFWGNLAAAAMSMSIVTPLVLRKVGLGFSKDVIKGLVKFGLPLIPSNIASYIVIASDRYFIKEYVSLGQTGIYGLGYKFGSLVMNFVTSPFNQIYGPRRLEAFKAEGSGELFGKVFTYFVFVIVFGGMGISVLARDVVHIMAEQRYWDAYKIVPLITLAHIVLSFFYHFNVGITYSKKTKYFAYINVTNAIVNLGLNITLIPIYGIWGAAWATFICYFLRSSMGFYFSNRLYKVYVEWGRVAIIFGVAFAFYFAFQALDVGNYFANLAIKSVLCLTYPLVLYVSRFFNEEEKQFMRDMFMKVRRKLRMG